MTELLTAGQMRAIEQAAINGGDVSGLELMERAGRGVVSAIFEEWPKFAKTDHHALVLCGPGNNGGDGFVVARLLAARGWLVDVHLYGEIENLPPDAETNCYRWLKIGAVQGISNAKPCSKAGRHCDLIVDGLFGTGLTRPLSPLGGLIARLGCIYEDSQMNKCHTRIVAIDIPSGTCSDSGRILCNADRQIPSPRIPAHLTVTFHRPRVGHYLDTVANRIGTLVVKDIGLGADVPINAVTMCMPRPDLAKDTGANKFHHGHAVILSGPATKTGAARLAARGALRIGAGLVTIGCPRNALAEHAAQLNAIMLREFSDSTAFAKFLNDDRITSLCLGPGMGLVRSTREMIEVALTSKRKTVLDADALSVFQDAPQKLFDLLHENVVLTPHGGEFSRLFPDIARRLNEIPTIGPAYSKLDAVRATAARAGCVVVYKGPDTVIAAPDGTAVINRAQAPWLATAGSGDVLAGIITGLLARGFSAFAAAESGVWLHSAAGRRFGPGLIAEDLADQLPAVFRELGL